MSIPTFAEIATAREMRSKLRKAQALLREKLQGKKVVGVVSGGNLPLARFAELIRTQ